MKKNKNLLNVGSLTISILFWLFVKIAATLLFFFMLAVGVVHLIYWIVY